MPAGCATIHHHSPGPAIQPVFNLAKSTPVQPVDSQILHKDAVGDSIKDSAEVQADTSTAFPSSAEWVHLAIAGDQVAQAGPALPKPILARPDPLAVLYVPCDRTQDDLLYDLPWHQSQIDRPVVSRIFLLAVHKTAKHLQPFSPP